MKRRWVVIRKNFQLKNLAVFVMYQSSSLLTSEKKIGLDLPVKTTIL